MNTTQAQEALVVIKQYYDEIKYPKHRNLDFTTFKAQYDQLTALKPYLKSNVIYTRLVSAMSQVIARIEEQHRLLEESPDDMWANLSERGMNKVIPSVDKRKVGQFPVQWTDKWGNDCYVSNGYWTAKNYRVMDALGYMLLLKEGGDRLPEECLPIFNDLMDIEIREHQLNGSGNNTENDTDISLGVNSKVQENVVFSIGFGDNDFRKFTALNVSSTDILNLLLETSRVEFKLSFPVRLKSTGNKENLHRMNYYSRFFEMGHIDKRVRKDGIVQQRRYRVYFSTLLGELFVNNLKSRYNDWVDLKFYTLPDSAQLFYRRRLLHNDYKKIPISLINIANAAGLCDPNETNLIKTIETNVFEPLKGYGYISDFKQHQGHAGIMYTVYRTTKKITSSKEAGSVNE